MGKYARIYALATQGILTMIILAVLGYFIGMKINKDSIFPGLFAGIGVIIGVIIITKSSLSVYFLNSIFILFKFNIL